jgi:hypothetical protein
MVAPSRALTRMRSPFGSELGAFHLLLLTVAAFAAVALASLFGGAWVWAPVWAGVTAAAVLFYLRTGRSGRPLKTAPAHVGGPDERRILVLAHEPVAGETLVRQIKRSAGDHGQVLVVSPAFVSKVRHWTSDLDGARAEAGRRLDEHLSRLRAAGIEAHGEIGDEDPLRAIEDALRTFGADEIVISTHPADQASRLEDSILAGTRERFALPVTDVPIETV